jgi:colanic acid biosynthesis glycosyl transferase WcaI
VPSSPQHDMKILIHGINYAPEIVGTGKYTGELGPWLAARGHEVRVVTAPPYYPAWRVEHGYSARQYRCERIAGVDVWRCPVWVPDKPSAFKRLLHLASFAACSSPVMLRQALWRPDAVVLIEPTLFCAPAAWLTARLCAASGWLHIQDL